MISVLRKFDKALRGKAVHVLPSIGYSRERAKIDKGHLKLLPLFISPHRCFSPGLNVCMIYNWNEFRRWVQIGRANFHVVYASGEVQFMRYPCYSTLAIGYIRT